MLAGYFALAFRRPVAHLIRNRALRTAPAITRRATTNAFEVLAALRWQVPIAACWRSASVVATLGGSASSENVLQISVVTALLLVLAVLPGRRIVLRMTRPAQSARARRSPLPHALADVLRHVADAFFIWLFFLRTGGAFLGRVAGRGSSRKTSRRAASHMR